jgi:hypothetical protein
VSIEKETQGKLRWCLLPYEAVTEVVKVLEFGAKKYAAHGWVGGMNWSLLADAIMRHFEAWQGGEDRAPDSGLLHVSHIACNALFLTYYALRSLGTDDRQWKRMEVKNEN